MNVIDAAVECNIARVVALSTDKASNPINLTGQRNSRQTSFSLPVIGKMKIHTFCCCAVWQCHGVTWVGDPVFVNQARHGVLPITHSSMTRFMISLEEGVGLVWKAFDDMQEGKYM